MNHLTIATILFALGLLLLVAEIFVPSAGIIGLVAGVCLAMSIGMGFYYGNAYWGIGFLTAAMLFAPAVLSFGIWFLPRTPLGRKLFSSNPTEDEVLPDDPELVAVRGLVGRIGVADCVMLPGGVVEIDGATYEAISEGGAIERGQPIKVIDVRTNRLVVRPYRMSEKSAPGPAVQGPDSLNIYEDADELSRSIEDLDLGDSQQG